jgi:hypothetical protein
VYSITHQLCNSITNFEVLNQHPQIGKEHFLHVAQEPTVSPDWKTFMLFTVKLEQAYTVNTGDV